MAAKRVVTRAQPEDKMEIIHSLQRQNLVVAMTGDGVPRRPPSGGGSCSAVRESTQLAWVLVAL